MSYHKNLHGIVERVVSKRKKPMVDEWYLKPGEGFVVCGNEIFIGNKYRVFERAKEHCRKKNFEVFGIMDENVGLMLSPTMSYKNASVAFNHESGHKQEIIEKEVLKGAVVYRGYIGDSKNHAQEIARNHRASLSKKGGQKS